MDAYVVLLLAALWAPPSAQAAAQASPALMASCEAQADADGLWGGRRRRYLEECFAGKRKPQSLQAQFSGCEAQARRKSLRGVELRSFMDQCMKA